MGANKRIPESVGDWRASQALTQMMKALERGDNEREWMLRSLSPSPFEGEALREQWLAVAEALDDGEGIVPGDLDVRFAGQHVRWLQLVNDNDKAERVLCTVYLTFHRCNPGRQFWDFPVEMFPVFRHKGFAPNPLDAAWGVRSDLLYPALGMTYRMDWQPLTLEQLQSPNYPKDWFDPEHRGWDYFRDWWAHKQDWDLEYFPPEFWSLESQGKDIRPIGITFKRGDAPSEDIWGIRDIAVNSDTLSRVLVALRRAGQKRIPLSLLRAGISRISPRQPM